MSATMLSSKISNRIMVKMYTKKPHINENGDMVFKKNGFVLFLGIMCTVVFLGVGAFMDEVVQTILDENNIENSMKDIFYFLGYTLTILLVSYGLRLIIMYKTHKIIVSKQKIALKTTFSTKNMNLSHIDIITFSNVHGLVFQGRGCKIKFGNFTSGLVELLKFIEENISKEKCESAIIKARKMLRRNKVAV